MARSSLMKTFKEKTKSNNGVSIDSRKVNGVMKQEFIKYDSVLISFDDTLRAKIETKIPRLSSFDRADIKQQVEELLISGMKFEEGQKIDLSQYIDTKFTLIYNGNLTIKKGVIEHKFLAC